MANNAEGRSGGLIMLWRRSSFVLTNELHGQNFLGVEGVWGSEQIPVTIVNVYSPCDLRGKKLLWEEIGNLMETRGGRNGVC